uniref:Putative secreted protein n=1 Tax=Anopheles triannulatus TaxID=58253 RepID=A0A2M4B476_9DIPT
MQHRRWFPSAITTTRLQQFCIVLTASHACSSCGAALFDFIRFHCLRNDCRRAIGRRFRLYRNAAGRSRCNGQLGKPLEILAPPVDQQIRRFVVARRVVMRGKQ